MILSAINLKYDFWSLHLDFIILVKITQEELGNLCGISRVQIARYEKGVNKPSEKILTKIANELGVPVKYFDRMYSINDDTLDAEYDRL